MSYTLEQARSDLKERLPWLATPISLEPLAGLVDGINRVFHVQHPPISQADGITLQDSAGNAITAFTVVSYEAGSLRLTTAPSDLVYAIYTALGISDAKLLNLCKQGFWEMQERYPRNYYLVASANATHISSDAESAVDPITGALTFSTSKRQLHFFLLCCEYTMLRAQYHNAAANFFMFREGRTSGVMVDRSRNAGDLAALLDRFETRLERARLIAAHEIVGQDAFGYFVEGAESDVYADEFDWWTDSEQAMGF